jgi:hypothetical protein
MNKILQFRRSKVSAQHVIWPTFLLLGIIIVLLAIWSALTGIAWKREIIDEESGESIGFCNFKNNTGLLLVPCVLLMLIPTIMVPIMAWLTKDVDSLYAESSWIFYGMFAQLQIIFISIPVIVILMNSTSTGRHVGMCLMLFGYSITLLGIVMLPKYFALWKARQELRFGKQIKKSTRGANNGVKVSGISLDGNFIEENGGLYRNGTSSNECLQNHQAIAENQ